MERRARVLFVIDELDIGGTEQQILELVKRLDRDRYVPMVVLLPARTRLQGDRVRRRARSSRSASAAKVDLRLIAEPRRRSCAGSESTSPRRTSSPRTRGRRLAAIIAGVPIIVTSERNVDMWEERFKPTHRTVARSLDLPDHRQLPGRQGLPRRKGLAPDKVDVIYNGVDPEPLRREPVTPGVTRSELGIPPHHSVVGLLARLEPQKDPRTFLARRGHRRAEAARPCRSS